MTTAKAPRPPADAYQVCIECHAIWWTRADLVAAHLHAMAGWDWDIPPTEHAKKAERLADNFCPECLHDFAFAPNTTAVTDGTEGATP